MKGQRYRFKLVTLLLMGLILLSLIHGARTIPLQSSSVSLRDAILRLTGQSTPTPAPEEKSVQLSGLGGEVVSTPSAPVASEEAASPSPEPSVAPSPAWTSPYDYPFLTPDASPTPAPAENASPASQSLSEALSSYFDSNE